MRKLLTLHRRRRIAAALIVTGYALAATLTACTDTDPCDGRTVTYAEETVLKQGPSYEIETEVAGVTCELSADTAGQWARESSDTTTTTKKPTTTKTPRSTR